MFTSVFNFFIHSVSNSAKGNQNFKTKDAYYCYIIFRKKNTLKLMTNKIIPMLTLVNTVLNVNILLIVLHLTLLLFQMYYRYKLYFLIQKWCYFLLYKLDSLLATEPLSVVHYISYPTFLMFILTVIQLFW
jgi:hypothetical protein